MKKIGKLSIRLFSLYFFIKAIITFKEIIFLYMPQIGGLGIGKQVVGSGYAKYFIVSLIIMIIIAVLLWLFTDNIVLLLIGEDEEEHITFSIEYEELLIIALKILGIILVLNAIMPALNQVFNLFAMNINGFDLRMKATLLIKLIEPIIRIVVGILLIIQKKPEKLKKV